MARIQTSEGFWRGIFYSDAEIPAEILLGLGYARSNFGYISHIIVEPYTPANRDPMECRVIYKREKRESKMHR